MLPIVVLAGGLATRLRPITETIPKSLVTINDEPFVMHQLRLFQQKGVQQVHFCLGFLGEQVETVIRASSFIKEMNITFSYDGEKLLGTGGSIVKAFEFLPETFFVTYGDSYLDIDYKVIHQYFNKNKIVEDEALMTVFKNQGQWDSSNVVFDKQRVVIYSKKNKVPEMEYIDYGFNILSKKNFEGYSSETTFGLEVIHEALSQQKKLIGFEVKQRFYEVGSFFGIEDFSNYLLSKKI
jgi:N-acetyl-alpha-D-muramate 1-phosphate uridylyltransferase